MKKLVCVLLSLLKRELVLWREEVVSQQKQIFDRETEILFGSSKQPARKSVAAKFMFEYSAGTWQQSGGIILRTNKW